MARICQFLGMLCHDMALKCHADLVMYLERPLTPGVPSHGYCAAQRERAQPNHAVISRQLSAFSKKSCCLADG
jgi:hypothetical protein